MTEEVQAVETVAEPVEVKEESASPTEETSASEVEKVETEAKPEKTFTQKELDDILTRRLAKEQRKIERYAKAEAEVGYLREQLSRQSQASQPSVQSGEPKPEQFKTYEEYLDKLTDWKVDLKLAKMNESSNQQRQVESQQSYESTIAANLSKAADKFDDFEEVVESIPAKFITIPMRDAIGESEIAGEIAYYLGNNHKEAAEIAKMTNVQQVKAIDKLEAKLKTPPQVSKAPAPLETVGKGRSKTEPDVEKMSVSEYAEYRAKNGARWAKR